MPPSHQVKIFSRALSSLTKLEERVSRMCLHSVERMPFVSVEGEVGAPGMPRLTNDRELPGGVANSYHRSVLFLSFDVCFLSSVVAAEGAQDEREA